MNEKDTYSIVLRDHESDSLVFIAEVRTYGDIERIKQVKKELYEEYDEERNDWDDFYEELGLRTWLNIYRADVLDI